MPVCWESQSPSSHWMRGWVLERECLRQTQQQRKAVCRGGWWWPRNSGGFVFFLQLGLRVSRTWLWPWASHFPAQADSSPAWLWWATVVINFKARAVSDVVGVEKNLILSSSPHWIIGKGDCQYLSPYEEGSTQRVGNTWLLRCQRVLEGAPWIQLWAQGFTLWLTLY